MLTRERTDPALIQSLDTPIAHDTSSYSGVMNAFLLPSQAIDPPSPTVSETSSHDPHTPSSIRFRSGTRSPYLHSTSSKPYSTPFEDRRPSISSSHSRNSQESPRSSSIGFEEEGKERGRCPKPDCGRLFKDLKAHMLTHQSERPEKCPIVTCEYHLKGFARKYDKSRHTLTHYKGTYSSRKSFLVCLDNIGTMVCGFCPGSGSAAEKSFNRADVFKRHLTSVHNVEQTPPNSRKKSPTASVKNSTGYPHDATGKCSTCSAMFSNAQEFYEHLDDCVLRVVQQEEPSEAINEQRLAEVANDQDVQETLDRHLIPSSSSTATRNGTVFDAEDDDEDADDPKEVVGEELWSGSTSTNPRSGKGAIKSSKGHSS